MESLKKAITLEKGRAFGSEDEVSLNFKISRKLRNEIKIQAINNELTLHDMFLLLCENYAEKRVADTA